MKLFPILAAALIAMSGAAQAADQHGHEHKPLHGGIVTEAGHLEFELVAKADSLTLYARDHGKPVNAQGARAKLTLLSGTEQSEVQLAAAGDKLQATGSFKVEAGTKVVAMVEFAGRKPSNVRFAIK